MRSIVFTAAFAVVSISCAFAADDIMASRFGNTTMATDSKGVQTKIYYQADGTLTAKQGTMDYKGTWKLDAKDQLCLTFDKQSPQGMTNPFCVTVTAHKVGDSWKAGDRTVMLVKGIQ